MRQGDLLNTLGFLLQNAIIFRIRRLGNFDENLNVTFQVIFKSDRMVFRVLYREYRFLLRLENTVLFDM